MRSEGYSFPGYLAAAGMLFLILSGNLPLKLLNSSLMTC